MSPTLESGPPLANVAWQRPSRAPEVHSPLLNRFIKDCRSWWELSDLVERHGHSFNFIHVASCVTHLAQLTATGLEKAESAAREATPCRLGVSSSSSLEGGAPYAPTAAASWPSGGTADRRGLSALMERLLLLTDEHLHQFGVRQASNVLWSLAHLHPLHPRGCAALASEMLPMMRALLPWCEPQHLSNIIWAVANLDQTVCPGLGPTDAWLEEFLVCSERTIKVGRGAWTRVSP